MRRLAVLCILCPIILSACGGSGSSSSSCTQDFWDGTVGVCLPDGWIVIDHETLQQRGVPEETVAVFQSEAAVSGQFPTIAVTEEKLPQEVTPGDYSSASIRSVAVLPQYQHIDTRDVRLDNVKVQIHIFSAQPSEGEPRRRYYQVSTSKGTTGYTLTATTPVAIDDALEKQIGTILGSFTLEAPKEEK